MADGFGTVAFLLLLSTGQTSVPARQSVLCHSNEKGCGVVVEVVTVRNREGLGERTDMEPQPF